MRCPGSISLSEGIENVSSAFAEEGSRLHALSEDMLRGQTRLFDTEEFTDEQLSVAQAYVDVVQREHEELGGSLLVEQRFKLPQHPEFFGTADAVIVSPPHLRVLDLKAGRGVAVEVDYGGKINPQLGFYALGALTVAGNPEQFTDIEVVVVQPRLGGVKRRRRVVVQILFGSRDVSDVEVARQHARQGRFRRSERSGRHDGYDDRGSAERS